MKAAEKKLCIEIARDPEVWDALNKPQNQYYKIANVQRNLIQKQLPEPWNGHLSTAKIMFISSNPSIDFFSTFPTENWNDEDICNFFDNRFSIGEWVRGEKVSVKFWNKIIDYANDILKEDNKIKKASKSNNYDYSDLNKYVVCTEIVHCKSTNQEGVNECKNVSFNRWMSKIIDNFTGDYIVLVGHIAKSYQKSISNMVSSRNKTINILQKPHPNARTTKTKGKNQSRI